MLSLNSEVLDYFAAPRHVNIEHRTHPRVIMHVNWQTGSFITQQAR